MVRELMTLLKALDFGQLRRWGIKGGFAVVDQGLFSGSNFVLNILLARWLPPGQYGAFSVAFAIYLFFTGFHNALILEPVSVFGTAKYLDILKDYLAGQFFIHFVITGLSGLIIFVLGLVFYSFHLVEEFLSSFIMAAGLFLPFMLLIWLARRSCYISGKPGWALLSSLTYSIVLFSGAFFIHSHSYLSSPWNWYLLLGIAGLIGSLSVYVNPGIVIFRRAKWLSWFREQWSFGKWIILAAFLNFAGTQVQLFIVAVQLGLDQAGAFRALQNFMLPMMQVLTAISTLILPSVSFEFGQRNFHAMKSKATKIALALTTLSFVYLVALFVFARPAEQLLYNGKFSEFAILIALTGFVPLLTAVESGFSLVNCSLQRPVYYAVSTGTIAIVGIIFSPVFVVIWNL